MATAQQPATVTTYTMAAAQLLVFGISIGITMSSTQPGNTLVAYTNAALAATHPVYGLPNGWAFAVWGAIYIFLGCFSLYQLVPAKWYGGLESASVALIRLPTIGVEAASVAWSFLFGNGQYWMALLVIIAYDLLLFLIISRLRANYVSSSIGNSRGASVLAKLFLMTPYSLHAAWVTIATVLQLQINLLEEGWLPSEGFTIGLLALAVSVACYTVYQHADLPYTIVSAWALGGIISNQSAGSHWGCASSICPACQESSAPICQRPNSRGQGALPNGWGGQENGLHCSSFDPTNSSDVCVVPKSPLVVGWAIAFIVLVGLAYISGVVKAGCITSKEGVEVQAALVSNADKAEMEMNKRDSDVGIQPGATPDTAEAMNRTTEASI